MPPIQEESEDVKQKQSSSEAEDQDKEEFSDLDEKDLESLEAEKHVPYSRFKEKNEEAKQLKQQMQQLQEQYRRELQRAVDDAELRAQARFQREQESQAEYLDPAEAKLKEYEDKMAKLEGKISQLSEGYELRNIKDEISKLEKRYPQADVEAVLGWRKVNPNKPLEELMERSHLVNTDRAESLVRQILERKKKKAQSSVSTRESGIKLKPEDRPKNIKDANKAALKWLMGQ